MSLRTTLPGTRLCPQCKGHSEPTEWLPDPGLDPTMRQFQCLDCQTTWFQIIRTVKELMIVGERVRSLRAAKEGRLYSPKTDDQA